MAWESRKRGGRYYTRSRRINGRVVREYVGTGPMAEAVAALDAARRAERKARDDAWQKERDSLQAMDGPLDDLWTDCGFATRLVLVANGYHRHDRGEWRKRRGRG